MSRSVLIASGKGGVGKSTLTAALGRALAKSGSSVVIVDTDLGLRSQDALLGLEIQVVYDLIDAAGDDCLLDQALLSVPDQPSLHLLPAAQFARAKNLDPRQLRRVLTALKAAHDFVLIDCPAGIEHGLRNVLNAGTDESILVVTPDDIAIRDAERVAGILEAKKLPRPRLVVNRLQPELIARKEMYSAQVIANLLDLRLLGEMPEDPAILRILLRHGSLLDYDCEARSAVLRIAARLKGELVPFPTYGSRPLPWYRRLFSRGLKEMIPLDDH